MKMKKKNHKQKRVLYSMFHSEKCLMPKRPRSMQITLPDDLIFDILCRLPIESILKFKCVCKAWNYMTEDPVFINSQLNWSKVHPPKLLHTTYAEPISFFLSEISECKLKEVKLIDVNVFEEPIVMCSFNGLICIASRNLLDPLKICNPIARESLELPHSNFTDNRVVCYRVALGYDNITKRYIVIRSFVTYEGPRRQRTEMITLGETAWKLLTQLPEAWDGPVFHDGAFYWISSPKAGIQMPYQLIQLDLSTSKLLDFPQQFLNPLPEAWPRVSLLDLEGHLVLTIDDREFFCVFVVNNGSRHYFMKDDLMFINGTKVEISKYPTLDLISMPSQDNYIMKFTKIYNNHSELLVSYHAQDNTLTPLLWDINAFSFKPSLLSLNMAMPSRTG